MTTVASTHGESGAAEHASWQEFLLQRGGADPQGPASAADPQRDDQADAPRAADPVVPATHVPMTSLSRGSCC